MGVADIGPRQADVVYGLLDMWPKNINIPLPKRHLQ